MEKYKEKVTGLQITWSDLTKGHNIITDLGNNAENERGRSRRYAVWTPDTQQPDRHRIAEVGDDLDALLKKYEVKAEYVFRAEK